MNSTEELQLSRLIAVLRRNHLPEDAESLQKHFEYRRDYAIEQWGKANEHANTLEMERNMAQEHANELAEALKRAHAVLDELEGHTPETWNDRTWLGVLEDG